MFQVAQPTHYFCAFEDHVRPIVEYCSAVWSPVCKSDIRKIEAVQRRFTKRLKYCSRLSYAERLNYLKDETLKLRRLKQGLITIFKMFNNSLDVNFSAFFEFNTYGTTRGHSLKLVKPSSKKKCSRVLIRISSCKLLIWNSLSD